MGLKVQVFLEAKFVRHMLYILTSEWVAPHVACWSKYFFCVVTYFLRFPVFFLSFFLFVMEKDGKTCFNTETNYFDQRKACGAPVCWSKYTTGISQGPSNGRFLDGKT